MKLSIKRVFAGVLSAACLLTTVGFAEAQQLDRHAVKLSGRIGSTADVDFTVAVYNEGYGQYHDPSDMIYVFQDKTGADGMWTLNFNMDDPEGRTDLSGKYEIWVYANGTLDGSQRLRFRNDGEYQAAVDALNAIAKDETKDKDDFAQYASDNRIKLGFYFDELDPTDGIPSVDAVASEMLYNEAKAAKTAVPAIDKTDFWSGAKLYEQACIIAEVNAGSITNIFDKSEYFADSVTNLNKYLASEEEGAFILDASMKNGISATVKALNSKSVSDFMKNIASAVVLETVKAPDGVDNLRNVMNDFAYATGLSADSYSDSALSSAIGQSFSTITALKNALDNPGTGGGSQGGGSAGGSGGSGGGGGGTVGGSGGGFNVGITVEKENDSTTVTPMEEDIYVDIKGVAWAKDAIIGLTEKGIVNGKALNRFAPDDIVTREEFVKMLVEAFAKDAEVKAVSFKDVDANSWYYEYVAKAVSAGLIMGHSDEVFGTGEPISRQDIAVTLYRAVYNAQDELEYELEFTDTDSIADYAMNAVKTLSRDGIINGMGDNRFCPTENATRAQAAKMVYEILER